MIVNPEPEKTDVLPNWLATKPTQPTVSTQPIEAKEEKPITIESKDPPKSISKETTLIKPPELNRIEASLSNLHQQESQLMLAVQLKKFEEHLTRIENQQNDLRNQQEEQLQKVFLEQSQYQKIMEEQILNQQERINEHMQILTISGRSDFGSTSNLVKSSDISKIRQMCDDEFIVMDTSYK